MRQSVRERVALLPSAKEAIDDEPVVDDIEEPLETAVVAPADGMDKSDDDAKLCHLGVELDGNICSIHREA